MVILTPLAVFEAAGGLSVAAQRFAAARASLRRLADILTTVDPVEVPRHPIEIPKGGNVLRVESVSAGWVPGRTAVRDVSFDLPSDARIAGPVQQAAGADGLKAGLRFDGDRVRCRKQIRSY